MEQQLWYPTGSTTISPPSISLMKDEEKCNFPGPVSLGNVIRHPKQVLDAVNLRDIIPLADLLPSRGPLVKKHLDWESMQNASKQGSGGVTAPVAPGPGVTVESSAEVELSNSIENTGKFSKIMCLQFQPTDTYIEETLESDSVQKWIQDEKEARRLCNLKDWKVPYFTNDWELWMVIGVMWVTASAKTSTAEITLNSGGGKGSVGASGLASLTGMFKSSNRTEEKIGVAIHAHDYLWALSYMRIWKPTGQRKWRKEVVTGTNSHFGKSYLLGADEEDEASGDKPEVQDEFGIAYLPGIDIKLVKWVD